MGNTYVIYYGWLTDDESGEPNGEARRIAAARTPLLIAHLRAAPPAVHANITPQVLALMRGAGTQVFGYVATDFGRAELARVRSDIAEIIAAGVDGIFFDEADSLTASAKYGYYTMLAQAVRQHGRQVILNAGVSKCGEKIMEVADRVMVEHQWRDLPVHSEWMAKYASERFMGVSSNEEDAMGYRTDLERAIRDTREAWRLGVGWHCATDRYVRLADWFEPYVEALRC